MFYVWIVVWDKKNVHFYIFKPEQVQEFDDLSLDSYRITDNQKTTLRISQEGEVKNRGRKHDYSSFKEFNNNFAVFNEVSEQD